jgi:hydroxyethylthiazole kinase-like sugar kinase family protein
VAKGGVWAVVAGACAAETGDAGAAVAAAGAWANAAAERADVRAASNRENLVPGVMFSLYDLQKLAVTLPAIGKLDIIP